MALDLSKSLVIGISSRALFDLSHENTIFEQEGLNPYISFQEQNEATLLKPGTGFPIVKALLGLNALETFDPEVHRTVDVVVISRNNAETGLRIFNSINHYKLDIKRAAFTSGQPVAKYLQSFNVGLFLSASEEDVAHASDAGFPAALIYNLQTADNSEIDQIRIAFDGDAVLFSEESELIYQNQGIEAFLAHEQNNAKNPMDAGPFAKLLKTISALQRSLPSPHCPIRTALVTARSSPAHERVIRTLQAWGVRIDEAFFMGGISKEQILRAFNPHIYFDDHPGHCLDASPHVPVARVLTSFRKVKANG